MSDQTPPREDSETSYDALPYQSHPYDGTHPDRLATLASLFGLKPPPVETARVLELGSASGGNLIPLALAYPRMSLLGIDLSRRQIDQGTARIDRLGLTNIELRHQGIAEFSSDQPFDYILCHGVYSWVDREVQRKILEICADSLAETGIAYVSYNTYPGWHLRGMIRQMLCYHARQFEEPETQVRQARALLDFLVKSGPGSDPTYHELLKREANILQSRADSYLYHEHLEEVNEPLFFHQFIERAEECGLRYLAETSFAEMIPANFGSEVERTLRELRVGLLHAEQYLDFVRNRTFRRTLLCQSTQEPDRSLGPKALENLTVVSSLKPVRNTIVSEGEWLFESSNGTRVTVDHPASRTVLTELRRRFPAGATFAETLTWLRPDGEPTVRTTGAGEAERDHVAGLFLELYSRDLIELVATQMPYATSLPDLPRITPLAAEQVTSEGWVTNLRHRPVSLSPVVQELLPLLDGEHSFDELFAVLIKAIDAGKLELNTGESAPEGDAREQLLRNVLQTELETLVRDALLMPRTADSDMRNY